ncbi:MAG: hypothetical protein P8Y00_00230 [Deltaproteobacteria bacterium]
MKIYRGAMQDDRPVERECYEFKPLTKTHCGEIMYPDTYFRTESEAWNTIAATKLNLVNALRVEIAEKKRELLQLQFQLDDATALYYQVREGLRAFRESSK